MSFEWRELVRHMLDEIEYLQATSHGVSRERFLSDPTLRRAFVRSLEVIGEATKKMPEDLRRRHGTIDWRAMAGMRDRLIHVYFGVDHELVWEVVTVHVPNLREQLVMLLTSER